MWKGLMIGALVLVGTLGLLALRLFQPALFDPALRREFAVTGLAVGQATRAEMLARFGDPVREMQESAAAVYEYPAQGLLLRIDSATGRLIWYEITTPAFPTGRGVRVGASLSEIRAAYGSGGVLARFTGRARLRFAYGTAYALEFWLGEQDRLKRIVFYQA